MKYHTIASISSVITLSPATSGLIVIPAYQHVTIQEEDTITNLVVEIIIEAHASVTYVLQKNNQETSSRHITFVLKGAYAQVLCSGSLCARNAEKYDLTILQLHCASHTKSSVALKMVVDDAALCLYRGTIVIEPSATKSVAEQQHKALVLSEHGKVTSEPQLEVLTNDVICNHGSAISYVNPEQMHYLMSRGLSESVAKNCIVNGFLD